MTAADGTSPPGKGAKGPGSPGAPDSPDTSDSADTPGSADRPNNPNNPDTPDSADRPSNSDAPGNPKKPASASDDIHARRRAEMVEHQLRRRGIRSEPVLTAMGEVPREAFVPAELAAEAYYDQPLPIGEGQTISQPYIVAFMIEALELKGGETVLEVGAGSGYAAAVLSRIAGKVITIERIGSHAARARKRIEGLGYRNVEVVEGDGTLGWPAAAPYDAIVVTAGAPGVPASLKEQLRPGGRLVLPVGASSWHQELRRLTKRVTGDGVAGGEEGSGEEKARFIEERLAAVRFVPLVGEQGWKE